MGEMIFEYRLFRIAARSAFLRPVRLVGEFFIEKYIKYGKVRVIIY